MSENQPRPRRQRNRRALIAVALAALGACDRAPGNGPAADAGPDAADARPEPRDAAAPDATASFELTAEPQHVGSFAVVFDGDGFAVVWARGRADSVAFDFAFARRALDGSAAPGETTAWPELAGTPTQLQLFATAGGGYCAWYRYSATVSPIFALRLSRDGAALAPPAEIVPAHNPGGYASLAVAQRDRTFAALHLDRAQGVRLIFAAEDLQRVDAPLTVAPLAGAAQYGAELAWLEQPQRFVAVWSDGGALQLAELGPAGQALGAITTVRENDHVPAHTVLASDPDGSWLLGWADGRQRYLYYRDGRGGGWGPQAALAENRFESADLALLLLPPHALLAWESDAESSTPEVRAAWIDAAAGPAPTSEVPLPCGAESGCRAPQLAAGGGVVALVHSMKRAGSEHLHLSLAPVR